MSTLAVAISSLVTSSCIFVSSGTFMFTVISSQRSGTLLGESLGPTTIVIPADHVPEVRRLLMELGYLE